MRDDLQPHLAALATATPHFDIGQADVEDFAGQIFPGMPYGFERYAPVFANAAIETRHSSVPLDWYGEEHGLADRNALYIERALDLLEEAATEALDQAGLDADQIDAIVTVSSTGIAT